MLAYRPGREISLENLKKTLPSLPKAYSRVWSTSCDSRGAEEIGPAKR